MQISEELVEAQPGVQGKRIPVIAGCLVTAFATLLFSAFYWNRFAGLRSGNGSFESGMGFLAGLVPYRDYFTAGPPLNQLLSAAVLQIFGRELIVIRGFAVFERLVLALLLYFWLGRLFQKRDAAIAAIVAIVVSAGDPSNALTSYGFEAILFFVVSGFSAVLAFEAVQSAPRFACWALTAGVFAALSLGTKQTLGVGATLAIPVMGTVYLVRASGIRRAGLFLLSFAAGWLLVIGAILLWLGEIGAIHEFLTDVFQKGPAAKAAHSTDFVIRALHAAWGLRWGLLLTCLILPMTWPALRRASREDRPRNDEGPGLIWVGVLASLSILSGAITSFAGKSLFRNLPNFTIYFAFFGTGLLLVFYASRLLRGKLSERESQLCFLAGVCFSIAFMVGLSWPASFDMTYPALGFTIAAVLGGSGKWRRLAVYMFCAGLLFAATCEKLNVPHGFHDWFDPGVRFANTYSTVPELRGMLMPASTVRFIDGTVRIIRDHSSPNDTIFIYPELGLFYAITHRKPPTLAGSHNIDVVTDEFARSEAERVLRGKPAVVVYYPQPEWSLRADERLWRNGNRSGQRDLIAAVETLTKNYRLAASFDVPPNDYKAFVYVRP